MSTDAPEVKPGQVWADNDKRSAGRTLKVLALVPSRGHGGLNLTANDPQLFARCEVLTDIWVKSARSRSMVGAITWISVDRFLPTSRGYRLVEDVPATREKADE